MLRRRRASSLKLRAALIFTGIFGAIFILGFVILSWQSLSSAGERHHAGPTIALTLASGELERGPGATLRFPPGSHFTSLAGRNPGLWLIVDDGTGRSTLGRVPQSALEQFRAYSGVVESARFHVRGLPRPLSDASIERRGPLLLAAGGVDPATITLGDALRYVTAQGLVLILLALGAVGILGLLVALPLLTRALKRVTADAALIAADRPDLRLSEAAAPAEILPLVRSFNAAVERLSGELERRKRFIADVAHELRTPLAILSLQVEALPRESKSADLQRMLARMAHLVGQLLDVERLYLGARHRSEIDLAALAADVVADLAPIAVAAGYELSLDSPGQPVTISGDAHAIARAIGNLVGNAIAHAGGRGEICVTVSPGRSVGVSDEGAGIADSLRPQLFEPFSRERWDRDGCGMGLHLTREILRAHGGDALLLHSERGTRFRLQFP